MKKILEQLLSFRKQKGWEKYHTGANLALKLCIESAEVAELFEWGSVPDKTQLSMELADVQIILEYLAYSFEIDLEDSVLKKIEQNKTRTDFKENNWRT